MASPDERHGGIPVSHDRQLPRLKRIEGQVRGLHQMIAGGRDCIETAHQIDAVVAALRRVQADMVGDHLEALIQATVRGELDEARRRELALEIAALVARRP